MKLIPGRILRALYQIKDGKNRGATQEEIETVRKLLHENNLMQDLWKENYHITNILADICRLLKKENKDYFK